MLRLRYPGDIIQTYNIFGKSVPHGVLFLTTPSCNLGACKWKGKTLNKSTSQEQFHILYSLQIEELFPWQDTIEILDKKQTLWCVAFDWFYIELH